ncbi:MAG: hypothetical protein HYW50_02110 [Candidatus Diapherotrites archaeon]|nr:hypothetical protein [Candidatus Diapherotrites archaeon]
MASEEKLKKKIMKAIEEEGVELRYNFIVYVEDDKLKFLAHVNKGELHTVVGMLERAKAQLLKRIEEISQ